MALVVGRYEALFTLRSNISLQQEPLMYNICFCNQYYYFNSRLSRILQTVIADSRLFVPKLADLVSSYTNNTIRTTTQL